MGLIIRMSLISDGLQCKCALTIDIYIGTGRTYSMLWFLFWGLSCQRKTLAFLQIAIHFLLKYSKVQRVSDI